MSYIAITLHKGKEISVQRRHPWIFSGAIAAMDAQPAEGEIVEVFARNGEYLATGYYAGGSIAVRIMSFQRRSIDSAFWKEKLQDALDYRHQYGLLPAQTNVFRLFYGEGDGVPGLILDYYNGHVVLQAHSAGVHRLRHDIAAAVRDVLKDALVSIYDKSAESLARHAPGGETNTFLFGNASEVIVEENGNRFSVDFVQGQKTGFFIDQRENRSLLARYARNRRVLNTFSYTGGFSVYAGRAGASVVHSVDASAPAIAACEANMALNGLEHAGFVSDTFDFLKDKKNEYDLIVLDPPAFAKSRNSRHNAVTAYKRLNALAMRNVRKNGIIFTFSCSGVVEKALFFNTVSAAAMEARRNVRVLHYLGQPADHPVTPFFPEGEYLKGMAIWVE